MMDLENALSIIQTTRQKLSECALDKVHPAYKTATLISLHINQLRSLLAAHERASGSVNEGQPTITTATDSTPTISEYVRSIDNLVLETSSGVQGQDNGLASSTFDFDYSHQMHGFLPVLSQEDWLFSDFGSLGLGYLLGSNPLDVALLSDSGSLGETEGNHWHFA